MSARRTAPNGDSAPDAATALREAAFVGVVARPDGDALAAAGLLARALNDRDIPFQVRIDAGATADAVEADLLIRTGTAGGDVAFDGEGRAASAEAFETARELGVDPDPVLALAGVVAAERTPGADDSASLLESATDRELLERRPGVAVPVTDPADGLAHTTLVHAPFSGDVDATEAAVESLDLPATLSNADHRRLASLVAVDVAGTPEASARAAAAVERALRPYATPTGPFETLGGYADVLDAVARNRPGVGVALAIADETASAARESALAAWRDHATAVHETLRAARTSRSSGVTVARVEGAHPVERLESVARLLRDFRSPEPVALVVADERAAAASVDSGDVGTALDEAARSLGGAGSGDGRRGTARFEGERQAFVEAFREALDR